LGFSKVFATGDEKSIKNVLTAYEAAFNAKDAKTVVAIYHPHARIKSGSSYFSRQEYESRLPERIDKFGPLKYEDMEIYIKGNKATVEAILVSTDSGRSIKIKYIMFSEKGKWLIMDQDY
jgi:ketosteroid isomerase-like protein